MVVAVEEVVVAVEEVGGMVIGVALIQGKVFSILLDSFGVSAYYHQLVLESTSIRTHASHADNIKEY